MTFRESMADVTPPPRSIIHLATAHGVETIVAETLTWHAGGDRVNGVTGQVVGYVPERLVAVDTEGKTHTVYPQSQPWAMSGTLTPDGWKPDSLTFDRYGWRKVETGSASGGGGDGDATAWEDVTGGPDVDT